MVFPIGDDNSDRQSTPYVNYALIAVNVLVFVVFQGMGANDRFTYAFACVPAEILTGKDIITDDQPVVDRATGERYTRPGLQPTPVSVYLTLVTAMFMHGGLAHIAGNLWFLYIFGDNVEDYLGHGLYLAFYLIVGVLASLTHVFVSQVSGGNLLVPSLGASGAISGVLGAYMILYPFRRVTVILFRVLTEVPAWAAIGIWFAFQLIEGAGALGGKQGGVAYGAHVGGFVFGGAMLMTYLAARRTADPPADAGA